MKNSIVALLLVALLIIPGCFGPEDPQTNPQNTVELFLHAMMDGDQALLAKITNQNSYIDLEGLDTVTGYKVLKTSTISNNTACVNTKLYFSCNKQAYTLNFCFYLFKLDGFWYIQKADVEGDWNKWS